MHFTHLVMHAVRFFEVAGVLVMVGGALLAPLWLLRKAKPGAASGYRSLRNNLGAAILLGLELLVAADIIRTVAEEPTLPKVLVLGLIVIIRTFLSFTLEVELEGRWPWQRPREAEPLKKK